MEPEPSPRTLPTGEGERLSRCARRHYLIEAGDSALIGGSPHVCGVPFRRVRLVFLGATPRSGPNPSWPRAVPFTQIEEAAMAKVCQVTGKRAQSGNNVSHANNKTRRRW